MVHVSWLPWPRVYLYYGPSTCKFCNSCGHRASHEIGVQTDFYLTQGETHGQGAWVRGTRRDKEEEDRLDDFFLLCGSVEISLEDYFNRRLVTGTQTHISLPLTRLSDTRAASTPAHNQTQSMTWHSEPGEITHCQGTRGRGGGGIHVSWLVLLRTWLLTMSVIFRCWSGWQ